MSKPWVSKMWTVSPHNFNEEALSGLRFPKKVYIYDVTLRDGEQCPGVVFNKDDKVKIAQALDELRVHRLEAGMPAVSDEDFQAVKEIAHLGLQTKVKSFARARRDDIDLALKCDVWGVIIELPSSKPLIEWGYKWTEGKVIDLATEAAIYAKDHGLHVTFFSIDSTRADLEFLEKLYGTVVKEGKADAVAIVDTFGVISPWGFAYLVDKIKAKVGVPVEVHVHNDLGLATANTIAAVGAGAEVVHTNINGLGERSGGAALEEVAVGLRLLCGVELGLDYSKLYQTSRLVEDISGVEMPPIKPIVGTQSFAYEGGIPVMFCRRFREKGYPQGGLPYLPEFVGGEFKIIMGKKSGSYSILEKLDQFGLEATDEQVREILNKVKDESLKRKSAISDDVLRRIIKGVGGIEA
ncbi:MAG: hypothetical protein ACE5GD_07325 [Candidatus Geothermarchaeales archaeon]